jgi:putative membrane protein
VTFVGVALFAGGVSVFIALRAGLAFARAISSVDYVVLVCGVIAVLVVLCVVLSGVQGVVVMVTATGIGLVPAVVRTKRIHSMGCLLVPVMLYYV